jgi:hypothetical protein
MRRTVPRIAYDGTTRMTRSAPETAAPRSVVAPRSERDEFREIDRIFVPSIMSAATWARATTAQSCVRSIADWREWYSPATRAHHGDARSHPAAASFRLSTRISPSPPSASTTGATDATVSPFREIHQADFAHFVR